MIGERSNPLTQRQRCWGISSLGPSSIVLSGDDRARILPAAFEGHRGLQAEFQIDEHVFERLCPVFVLGQHESDG